MKTRENVTVVTASRETIMLHFYRVTEHTLIVRMVMFITARQKECDL